MLTVWDILSPVVHPERWEWTISRKNREAYVRQIEETPAAPLRGHWFDNPDCLAPIGGLDPVRGADDLGAWQPFERDRFAAAVGGQSAELWDVAVVSLGRARDVSREEFVCLNRPWPDPGMRGIENPRFRVVDREKNGSTIKIAIVEGTIRGSTYDVWLTIDTCTHESR